MSEQGIFDNLWNNIRIMEVIQQLGRSVPESVLFGSMIMYLITANLPFGIFSIFIIELILSHKFISWMITGTVGPVDNYDIKCAAGMKTARLNIDRIIARHQYPSYGFFSITAMATYLGLSTQAFSDVFEYMDRSYPGQWASRSYVAYGFIVALLLLFFIVRIGTCDGAMELLLAGLLAVIVGGFFFKINTIFFGKDSVNFLGLPNLVTKDEKGNTIYVCSKQA